MISPLSVGIAPTRAFRGTWWDAADLCRRLKFCGAEFKYEVPFVLPDRWGPAMIRSIARIGREESLTLSLHGPYTNIGALLSTRWEKTLDEHLRALDCAEALGASTLTVHPGWVEEEYATKELVSLCRERTVCALERLASRAGSVTVCLENQSPADINRVNVGLTPDQLLSILGELPAVRSTLDVGHANLLDGNPVRFFETLGPNRVRLAHLHDNTGQTDDHLPPGQGSVTWAEFLASYRSNGCRFPLFLELAGEPDDYVSGRDLLQDRWAELTARTGL